MELKNMGGNINFFENAIYTGNGATDKEYLAAYIKYIKTNKKDDIIKNIKTT